MTSVIEQFNENLRNLPTLVNDAICAIENSLSGTRQKYALNILKDFPFRIHLYYIDVAGSLVPQLSYESFYIEFHYADCKIKGGDLEALYKYVDQLCEEMNETYPFFKFSRTGEGSENNYFQSAIPITWTF